MAGSGGVVLELTKDVAFCAPPVSRDKVRGLLARTRAATLLQGYRGVRRATSTRSPTRWSRSDRNGGPIKLPPSARSGRLREQLDSMPS
jgi:ATP-grasp domain